LTRCKFYCESVSNYVSGSSIVLRPVITGSFENDNFYKYTPGGELKLEVVSVEVAKQFEPGKEYYIDISPVE
jgi:hypothetical protein